MKTTAAMGTNRTGLSVAPEMGEAMLDAVREFPPSSEGDEHQLAAVRMAYAREGERQGSLPPPSSMKQLASTAWKGLQGKSPNLFVDKLGERAAFERTGTRFYQALLSKFDAYGSFDDGPRREDIEDILREEFAHFQLVTRAIESLGGDPTVVTPSANVQAVASMGIGKVLADPRTNLLQGLEVLLTAELIDNDCWDALAELATLNGEDQLAADFQTALAEEREHLRRIRTWVAAAQTRSLKGNGAPPAGRAAAAAKSSGKTSSGGTSKSRARKR